MRKYRISETYTDRKKEKPKMKLYRRKGLAGKVFQLSVAFFDEESDVYYHEYASGGS